MELDSRRLCSKYRGTHCRSRGSHQAIKIEVVHFLTTNGADQHSETSYSIALRYSDVKVFFNSVLRFDFLNVNTSEEAIVLVFGD